MWETDSIGALSKVKFIRISAKAPSYLEHAAYRVRIVAGSDEQELYPLSPEGESDVRRLQELSVDQSCSDPTFAPCFTRFSMISAFLEHYRSAPAQKECIMSISGTAGAFTFGCKAQDRTRRFIRTEPDLCSQVRASQMWERFGDDKSRSSIYRQGKLVGHLS